MSDKQAEASALREKYRTLQIQNDHAVLRKVAKALDHKAKVERIRYFLEEHLDAEMRLIEATSDLESLEDRNKEIVQMLAEEERLVLEVEAESKAARDTASKALRVCEEISSNATAEEMEHLHNLPGDMTVEVLDMEIAAEEAKLDFIHANNPNAIRDFERRQEEIGKLREKLEESEEKLQRYSRQITKTRSKWEPDLDKLIEEISEAFSYNFEQIGCAGQVSVHKDEDFDQWAIQIKVKFRYDPPNHAINPTIKRSLLVTEKTKPSNSSTSTGSPAASAPSPPSSTSCPCSPSPAHPSASLTRSTRAWTRATSAWCTSAWWRSRAASTRASTSSSRRSSSRA